MRKREAIRVNFIHTQMLSNVAVCDELIAFYNEQKKFVGRVYINGEACVDAKQKDSLETPLPPNYYLYDTYVNLLQEAVNNYIELFPFCNSGDPWRIVSTVNIQHYKPHSGYFAWHTERQAKAEPEVSRHLVFMTYLNDVTDDGETEFFYQNTKIKPRKGLTVIWPADWTHYHRGIPSATQDKYIVTGWFNYV